MTLLCNKLYIKQGFRVRIIYAWQIFYIVIAHTLQ